MEGAARETQVSEWMNRLKSSIDRANEIQSRLHERLGPLLRVSEPSKSEDIAKPKEEIVTLANDIRERVWELDHISDYYDEILELLEI